MIEEPTQTLLTCGIIQTDFTLVTAFLTFCAIQIIAIFTIANTIFCAFNYIHGTSLFWDTFSQLKFIPCGATVYAWAYFQEFAIRTINTLPSRITIEAGSVGARWASPGAVSIMLGWAFFHAFTQISSVLGWTLLTEVSIATDTFKEWTMFTHSIEYNHASWTVISALTASS